MNVTDKFLRYVRCDTQSDPTSNTVPSTACQLQLADMLVGELHAMGIDNAYRTAQGYVYASIPANAEGIHSIGFISHMDVEPVSKGLGVQPIVHKNYDGGNIELLDDVTLTPEEFPDLLGLVGQDIITSDGTTLLGADDKAGVAEIMQMAQTVMQHPEWKHGKIGIAFTPDEEIGRGADFFDVPAFGCEYAYTVDGGTLGEVGYETFNAASAVFTCKGVQTHPGDAKGKMKNCLHMIADLIALFPADERPENTSLRQGFYHFEEVRADVKAGYVEMIIRDHDRKKFEERKAFCRECVNTINARYGRKAMQVTIQDSYYNCGDVIAEHFHLVENAYAAMRSAGVEPYSVALRGGTDGSRLSYMGLPCPNLCAGGHSCHSVYEFCSVQSLEKITEILLALVRLYAEQGV